MLRLSDITKIYGTGESEVHALKKVSVAFRKSEFVSILGHSGCGKTTLLNIIGGLDHYTEGDLLINGKSTKEFKDRDWDDYRNHSIGFVFQSYNLIPHQTVLSNVELALTLSGVKRQDRKFLAQEALTRVGLADQIHKLPNQLSGGQMQRVAIARALVNNPDIILADEPTGALDTETSVQVMEILKEVAKDKLVVMVTHNPELAEQYSTRLVRLKDGEIISDSMPYDEEDLPKAPKAEDATEASEPVPVSEERAPAADDPKQGKENKAKKRKKPRMSLFTAFSLSIRNLFTKKGRTFLTSFAGSIGIIGIALILSMSNGFQTYIDRLEEDTLSGYPLVVERNSADSSMFGELIEMFMKSDADGYEEYPSERTITSNDIGVKVLKKMHNSLVTNDLKSFKVWLDDRDDELKELTNDVKYLYNLDFRIYKAIDEENPAVKQLYPFSTEGSKDLFVQALGGAMDSMVTVWDELVDNQECLNNQYDMIDGHWPKTYNDATDNKVFEVVIAVDKYNRINDYFLCGIGLVDLETIVGDSDMEEDVDYLHEYSFDEIVGKEFKILLGAADYTYDEGKSKWTDEVNTTEAALRERIANAITIKISGIIRPKEGLSAGTLEGVIGYRSDLKNFIIAQTNDLEIVKAQRANETTDIISGKPFTEGNTLESALTKLGAADLDNPSTIKFYVKGFDEKEKLITMIDDYNASVGKDQQIRYNDSVGSLMSSINTIIKTISYVLIAFVSVSLIVSSIMIGIITYISVLERTKEIGVLRSIGASKHDITRLFNAETITVGFISGIIGILVTILLNIPINLIIGHYTTIKKIAILPWYGGVGLVAISMFLSFIAGFIPSKIAAKKDPVVALRSE